MKKLPRELKNKLIYASELTPLEPFTTHCLCGKCADAFYDPRAHKIWRTDLAQTVKGPCEICKRPGYDYAVQRRRTPLAPFKKGGKSDG